MTYVLRYSKGIPWKEFRRFPASDRRRIRRAVEEKLQERPNVFGKPLRRSLKGCRALRVGEYRIVYRVRGSYVDILAVAHRSRIYDDLERHVQ